MTEDTAIDRAKLIADVEQAERGNAPLSERILLACGWTSTVDIAPPNDATWINWHDPNGVQWGMGYGTIPPPNVTVSLDAALTLVPDELRLRLEQSDDGDSWTAYLLAPSDRDTADSDVGTEKGCATPALAICVAVTRLWNPTAK